MIKILNVNFAQNKRDTLWQINVNYPDWRSVMFNPAQLLYLHEVWFWGSLFIISIIRTAFMLLQPPEKL
jgi:hypothetical protein